jgi:RhoGAP domain/RUN domain
MNGIRIREFQGVIPLWGLLERLVSVQSLMGKPVTPKKNASQNSASNAANSHKNGTSSLHATVETVARLTFLRTPVAKSRGWIRHALNTRTLDDCLNTLLQEAKILSLFYSPDAILSHPDNVTIFMAVIRTLKVLPFEFSLDDVSLNSTPSWAVAMVTAGGYRPLQSPPSEFPMMTGRSSSFYSHNRAPQKQRGIFSSIFGSIERSMNGVFDTVDNYANRSLDIEVKDNRERRELKEMMERERDNLPPLIPLFGTSLRDLVLDSRRCGVSHMAPQLGVPSMVISMISFLTSNVDTPGLFRQKINLGSSEELRLFLESERGIPGLGSMSESENEQMVHIVAFTLLQWLTELSEPLLGSTHYYALEACQEVEEEKPRIRNFSLLLQEAPWYSQPLLSKILSFLCLCLDEEHSTKNGLSLVAISVLFTPFLFRKDSYLHNVREHSRIGSSFFSSLNDVHMVERDEEARHYLSIAAAGTFTVMSMLLLLHVIVTIYVHVVVCVIAIVHFIVLFHGIVDVHVEINSLF